MLTPFSWETSRPKRSEQISELRCLENAYKISGNSIHRKKYYDCNGNVNKDVVIKPTNLNNIGAEVDITPSKHGGSKNFALVLKQLKQ